MALFRPLINTSPTPWPVLLQQGLKRRAFRWDRASSWAGCRRCFVRPGTGIPRRASFHDVQRPRRRAYPSRSPPSPDTRTARPCRTPRWPYGGARSERWESSPADRDDAQLDFRNIRERMAPPQISSFISIFSPLRPTWAPRADSSDFRRASSHLLRAQRNLFSVVFAWISGFDLLIPWYKATRTRKPFALCT